MNRKKLKGSLALLNLAVLIGATTFLPRNNYSYFWSSESERIIKKLFWNLPYTQIISICILSLLITSAIYLFIDAFFTEETR